MHRDVKPSNVFLVRSDDGAPPTVKVLDFGLAVVGADATRDARLTPTGAIVGTPAFMAPEQARGSRTEDERTDVYGLGAVLYNALTGTPPAGTGSALEVIARLLTAEPMDVAVLRPRTPAPLRDAVMSALSRDPAARPATMAQLEALLARVDLTGHREDGERAGLESVAGTRPRLSGERRVVTVVLARGVTDLQAVVDTLKRQGGRTSLLGADNVVGLFGGDVKEGDEAARAVEAAREVEPLCSIVGVGTGHAAGDSGHFAGDAFRAAEDATLVPGKSLVIDDDTREYLAPTTPSFDSDGASFDSDRTAVAHVRELPLTGRDVELAEVSGHIRRAFADEEPLSIAVIGPPGIGRSRLLREVADAIRVGFTDARVIELRCESARRFRPWSLLRDALRSWMALDATASTEAVRAAATRLARERRLNDTTGQLLAAVAGAPLQAGGAAALDAARSDAQVMRDLLVQAVGDLLEAEAAVRPVLLAVDDAHHADTPSLEALDVLLRRLEDGALVVVATARDHAIGDRDQLFGSPVVVRLALRELSKKAARKLALEVGVSAPVAKRIAQHAGGNPLFVLEIARAALSDRVVSDTHTGLRLPLNVEDAVQARLDYLAAQDKDVVKVASVFGTRFYGDALDAMGFDGVAQSLTRLERQNLVSPARGGAPGSALSSAYEFRVGVVRDVAYGMLTEAQRGPLHLRVGRWLQTAKATDAAGVAFHLQRGGDSEAARPLWLEAAEHARRDGDLPTALAHLTEALQCGGEHEVSIRLRRLELAVTSGTLAVADEDLSALEAHEDQLSERDLALVWHWRGAGHIWRTRYQDASDWLQRACEAFERLGEGALSGRSRSSLALAWSQGSLGPARPIAEQAVIEVGDEPMLRARALHMLHYVHMYEGDIVAARGSARDTLEACRVAGDLRRSLEVMVSLAHMDTEVGRYPEAQRRLEEIVQGAERIGNQSAAGYALLNLGSVLWRTGRPMEGLAALGRALERARQLAHDRLVLGTLCYRALVLADVGSVAESVAAAAEAVRMAAGGADEVLARTAMATALHRAGRNEDALAHAEQARTLRDRTGRMTELEVELMLAHASILAALGRHEDSRERLLEARKTLYERADELTHSEEERSVYLTVPPAHRRLAQMQVVTD